MTRYDPGINNSIIHGNYVEKSQEIKKAVGDVLSELADQIEGLRKLKSQTEQNASLAATDRNEAVRQIEASIQRAQQQIANVHNRYPGV